MSHAIRGPMLQVRGWLGEQREKNSDKVIVLVVIASRPIFNLENYLKTYVPEFILLFNHFLAFFPLL